MGRDVKLLVVESRFRERKVSAKLHKADCGQWYRSLESVTLRGNSE